MNYYKVLQAMKTKKSSLSMLTSALNFTAMKLTMKPLLTSLGVILALLAKS